VTQKPEDRVDRVVSDLLRGKRLALRGGDADEKEALIAAARLTAARHAPHRMSPMFRQRLARSLAHTSEPSWMTRRAALVAGLGLAAGAAAGGLAGARLANTPERRAGSGSIDPVNGRWVDVAALTDLTEGQGHRVTAGAVSAYVFRRGSSVTAVSSVCSHLPCELWWNGGSGTLDCPCHPASFSPGGQSTSYSYPLPALNAVHVRVTSAGRVEVMGTA
jgi:nitrite reductase/ring-hydroxylating ferredoxin subunit